MTDRKGQSRSEPKPKERPKTERPPETARNPKSGSERSTGDEGRERPTEQGGRDFNPNVNQRPR